MNGVLCAEVNCRGDFLLPGPEYHRRQADILIRLSVATRDPDTAAALLWLATEQRAMADLGERPTQQQQQQQQQQIQSKKT